MKEEEFVINQNKNGEIIAGGYKVNTMLGGDNIMANLNTPSTQTQSGGAIATAMNNLAVPAGLFYLQQKLNNDDVLGTVQKKTNSQSSKSNKKNKYNCDDDVVSESLFDKLLAMVEPTQRKLVDVKTRKRVKGKARRTRKKR